MLRKHARSWTTWLVLNLVIAGYLSYALLAPASSIKTTFLPGKTTHGHYQIELDCNACHAPAMEDQSAAGAVGAVMQDACNRCHADQLRIASDTHPAKKFNDPTNADMLLVLDAQNCLTCHREHVPEQTSAMGLTVPNDYCWHCHQDVADSRPSHADLSYTSCSTAGCHNYHDNRALYEKYLNDHFGQSDHLAEARVPLRNILTSWDSSLVGKESKQANDQSLQANQHDGPADQQLDQSILDDWASTAHAAAGVNCSACHSDVESKDWSDTVSMDACGQCHEAQTESFVTGRHGMRLAVGLSPMSPSLARLPMHTDSAHRELTCNSCHGGHRFDTEWASVGACKQCHADAHTIAYDTTAHADLWNKELAGELPAGSGVSCATCHMPRLEKDGDVWVNHDQNANLRPNETMAREVCGHCHGLEYSLSALSDPQLVDSCFADAPLERNESVRMAHDWFELKEQARKARKRTREKSNTGK